MLVVECQQTATHPGCSFIKLEHLVWLSFYKLLKNIHSVMQLFVFFFKSFLLMIKSKKIIVHLWCWFGVWISRWSLSFYVYHFWRPNFSRRGVMSFLRRTSHPVFNWAFSLFWEGNSLRSIRTLRHFLTRMSSYAPINT